ncbi:hypothetical protein OIO90_000976 [Microbotryomycetes sp. JL221]|nr:hypothetical protein OIO90_000976 [Microbotryomycetes sp. JL221]
MFGESLATDSLFNVKGKTAVVTGGGTGIGWYIANGLAVNGATVFIVGRRRDKLDDAVKQFESGSNGGKLIALPGDVSTKDSVAKLVEDFKRHESKLDILVNSAGVLHADPVKAHPDDAYKQQPGSAEAPRESPNIINIGSIAGMHNARDAASVSYQTSKSAVIHLTKCLATRFLPLHVRVNCLAPGLFPSEMTQPDPKVLRQTHKTHFKAMPEGRAGAPPDIAGPVLFLSSRAGAYMNGNTLDVGGGRSLLLSGAILPDA